MDAEADAMVVTVGANAPQAASAVAAVNAVIVVIVLRVNVATAR